MEPPPRNQSEKVGLVKEVEENLIRKEEKAVIFPPSSNGLEAESERGENKETTLTIVKSYVEEDTSAQNLKNVPPTKSPPGRISKPENFEHLLKRSMSRQEASPHLIANLLQGFNEINGDDDGIKVFKEKVFNDCIHGSITFPPAAVAIVDSKVFQRLRKLYQTGTSYLVFPNATHNRFQHSIGVGHLGWKFAEHLRMKYGFSDEKDSLCVMIAGLCHDLGHGPHSHLWEHFIHEARGEDKSYRHEDTSIKMFDHLIESENLKPVLKKYGHLDDQDLTFIKELIVGPLDAKTGCAVDGPINLEPWPYKGREKSKSFLYEIIANKLTGIDVDKWDYFLRDDKFFNIGHVFDYQRFITYSIIDKTGEPSIRRILLRDKESSNLKEMYRDRARLHTQGYQHAVVKKVDRMMVDVWLAADPYIKVRGSGGRMLSLSEASDDVISHMKLTDYYVEHRIEEDERPELDKARKILERIYSRNFYPVISGDIEVADLDFKPKEISEEFFEKSIKELAKSEFGKRDFDICVSRKKVTSGLKAGNFFFYNKDGSTSATSTDTINLKEVEEDKITILSRKDKGNLEKEDFDIIRRWKDIHMKSEQKETNV